MKKILIPIILSVLVAVSSCGPKRYLTTSRAPGVALERINIGAYNNDPGADKARTAFGKADLGIAELNRLRTYDLEEDELAILMGATITTAELNRLAGVTSAIQTQINNRIRTVDSTGNAAGNYVTRKALADTVTNKSARIVRDAITDYLADAEVGIALADSTGYAPGNYLPRYSAEQLITSVAGSMGAPDFWVEAMQALGGNIKAVPLWCDMDASTSYTLVDGTIFTSAFYLTKDMLITGVRWALATQGDYTADNNNRIGLYKVTGTTATLVASTANDPDLWKSAAYAWQTLPFTQSYQAEKGIYYVSFIYNSSAQVTAPAIYAGESFTLGNMSSFLGNGVRVRGIFSAQTDLQASFNITHANTQNASPMMILY